MADAWAGRDSDSDGLDDLTEIAFGTNPFDPDTNDNGMPDGEEIDNGGDPINPGPPPAPLPPPSPDPEPPADPAPQPPAPITPGDYDILVETKTVSFPKYGHATFQVLDPPERYLTKTANQTYAGSDGEVESGPLGITGLATWTIDPATGQESYQGDTHKGVHYVTSFGNPVSPFRLSGTRQQYGYDDPPNQIGDGTATITGVTTLSNENTTQMMVDNGMGKLEAFEDDFQPGTPFAYRNVHENELAFDYQRVQFKFKWHNNVPQEQRFGIEFVLLFIPEDDAETPEDESLENAEVIETLAWAGQAAESQVFPIDPDQKKPNVDGTYRVCPLRLVQSNMPNVGVAENSTDLGGPSQPREVGDAGRAFITGEPTVPQLRAGFASMPSSVSVDWRLEIRTERPTVRGTLDDRDAPAQGWEPLPGDQEWDIAAALNGEFVGGNCTLHYPFNGGDAGSITFLLRGKNPLDADAQAHINAAVGADFASYAWAMAKHESRQGDRVYNQFNTQAGIEGTLNFGGPNGWGVAQIDRPVGNPGVTTAEVWNWHENITAMREKLIEKQDTYNRFIGYFRDSYGSQQNWTEPPAAHAIGATTLPAEAWGVMVLYNGADGGVPQSSTPTHQQLFRSPWVFNPTTGTWTFHDNSQDYATGRVRPELENTINTQE